MIKRCIGTKKQIELNSWNQEKFYACLMISRIEEHRNNISETINYSLKTLTYDQSRWEGIYWLIKYYYENDEHNIANFLVNGIDLSTPPQSQYGYLFIDESIHTYKLYLLILIISYKYKEYEKGRNALFLLYNNFNKLDISVINNVIYNGQFFIPNDDAIQKYLNLTLSFIQKCIDKYPLETNNDTTISILNNYINLYTKYTEVDNVLLGYLHLVI